MSEIPLERLGSEVAAYNESFVDAACTRVLREKVALRLLDGPQWLMPNRTAAEALKWAPEHRALARLAATEGVAADAGGAGGSGHGACRLCREERDERSWSGALPGARVCRRCVRQSAAVLQKDPDLGWRKPEP